MEVIGWIALVGYVLIGGWSWWTIRRSNEGFVTKPQEYAAEVTTAILWPALYLYLLYDGLGSPVD